MGAGAMIYKCAIRYCTFLALKTCHGGGGKAPKTVRIFKTLIPNTVQKSLKIIPGNNHPL